MTTIFLIWMCFKNKMESMLIIGLIFTLLLDVIMTGIICNAIIVIYGG